MLEEIAPNLSLQRHPLRMAGCKMGRVVTLIRLLTGKLVIHSTARFSHEHISEISEYGVPAWLADATNFHDTCAKQGRQAFPDLPYLVPSGFQSYDSLRCTSIDTVPPEWNDEIEVIKVAGMPKIQEHAFYHRTSKTLIVADLLFNIPPEAGRWTHGFLRATAGIREYPGMSRLFRYCIKDRAAFAKSMRTIAALDFERIVVAHGNPIVDNAKTTFLELLAKHGFDMVR
jgi:hypothetical protein